jgi:opacity protein-like surface antigen
MHVTAIGIAAIAALIATPALAADMAVKAPPPAPAPAYSWTGFYIGGYLGGGLTYSLIGDPFGHAIYGDDVRSPAFLAGGRVGANYQFGALVVGAEADASWAKANGANTCFAVSGGFYASNCVVSPDLFGTLTGRLGYAFGRTLLYGKVGVAFEHNNVDVTVNRNQGNHELYSSTEYGAWGWTGGGGLEYALTPAWSLSVEYDYLGFGSHDFATPYVLGNPLLGHPVGPIASLSDAVQEFKLGINYKLGADPVARPTGGLADMALAPKAFLLPVSGWEIEAGSRYMFSSGRAQWDVGANVISSRLTWYDLLTNSGELYGRIDSPWNVSVSGFIGTGDTFSGKQNDEDFGESAARRYQNTFSTNTGHIGYAVIDLGYDAFRTAGYTISPFIGYTRFNEYIFKYGCVQIANPLSNCVAAPTPPLSSFELIGLEDMTWQAMRLGISGQVKLTDRLKLEADVAGLTAVNYSWMDDHLAAGIVHNMYGAGAGVQTQAVLSYDVTDRLNVGIGARYWDIWSYRGVFQNITAASTSAPGPNRNAIDLAGVFAQLGYRFVPGDPAPAKSASYAWAPIYKAVPTVAALDWSGFYAGVEGGGVWGTTGWFGQTFNDHTFDATPGYHVGGALVGGTLGYNSQFDRHYIFGLEGDMSWTSLEGGATQLPPFNTTQQGETNEPWLGTARVRLGYTPGPKWLVYGTGGLAAADVVGTITNSGLAPESHVRAGWTAGGGIESAIARNWSAKLEYLYVGLENHAYDTPTPNVPGGNRAGGMPLAEQIVRAGINYKIDWDSLAALSTAANR